MHKFLSITILALVALLCAVVAQGPPPGGPPGQQPPQPQQPSQQQAPPKIYCNQLTVTQFDFESTSAVFGGVFMQFEGLANIHCRVQKSSAGNLQIVTIQLQNAVSYVKPPACIAQQKDSQPFDQGDGHKCSASGSASQNAQLLQNPKPYPGLAGPFGFVRTEDGQIIRMFGTQNDDEMARNLKRGIVGLFQTNINDQVSDQDTTDHSGAHKAHFKREKDDKGNVVVHKTHTQADFADPRKGRGKQLNFHTAIQFDNKYKIKGLAHQQSSEMDNSVEDFGKGVPVAGNQTQANSAAYFSTSGSVTLTFRKEYTATDDITGVSKSIKISKDATSTVRITGANIEDADMEAKSTDKEGIKGSVKRRIDKLGGFEAALVTAMHNSGGNRAVLFSYAEYFADDALPIIDNLFKAAKALHIQRFLQSLMAHSQSSTGINMLKSTIVSGSMDLVKSGVHLFTVVREPTTRIVSFVASMIAFNRKDADEKAIDDVRHSAALVLSNLLAKMPKDQAAPYIDFLHGVAAKSSTRTQIAVAQNLGAGGNHADQTVNTLAQIISSDRYPTDERVLAVRALKTHTNSRKQSNVLQADQLIRRVASDEAMPLEVRAAAIRTQAERETLSFTCGSAHTTFSSLLSHPALASDVYAYYQSTSDCMAPAGGVTTLGTWEDIAYDLHEISQRNSENSEDAETLSIFSEGWDWVKGEVSDVVDDVESAVDSLNIVGQIEDAYNDITNLFSGNFNNNFTQLCIQSDTAGDKICAQGPDLKGWLQRSAAMGSALNTTKSLIWEYKVGGSVMYMYAGSLAYFGYTFPGCAALQNGQQNLFGMFGGLSAYIQVLSFTVPIVNLQIGLGYYGDQDDLDMDLVYAEWGSSPAVSTSVTTLFGLANALLHASPKKPEEPTAQYKLQSLFGSCEPTEEEIDSLKVEKTIFEDTDTIMAGPIPINVDVKLVASMGLAIEITACFTNLEFMIGPSPNINLQLDFSGGLGVTNVFSADLMLAPTSQLSLPITAGIQSCQFAFDISLDWDPLNFKLGLNVEAADNMLNYYWNIYSTQVVAPMSLELLKIPDPSGTTTSNSVSEVNINGQTTTAGGVTIGAANLYSDCNYGGQNITIAFNVTDFGQAGIPNDAISSVQVTAANTYLILFEDSNYQGSAVIIGPGVTSQSCLSNIAFNDMASSLVLITSPTFPTVLRMYDDCNYGGKQFVVFNSVSNVGSNDIDNDSISSVIIPAGMTVTFFADANYGGKSLTLTGPLSVSCLTTYNMNDQISSLQINGQH